VATRLALDKDHYELATADCNIFPAIKGPYGPLNPENASDQPPLLTKSEQDQTLFRQVEETMRRRKTIG
jgi:hypothetical protein